MITAGQEVSFLPQLHDLDNFCHGIRAEKGHQPVVEKLDGITPPVVKIFKGLVLVYGEAWGGSYNILKSKGPDIFLNLHGKCHGSVSLREAYLLFPPTPHFHNQRIFIGTEEFGRHTEALFIS